MKKTFKKHTKLNPGIYFLNHLKIWLLTHEMKLLKKSQPEIDEVLKKELSAMAKDPTLSHLQLGADGPFGNTGSNQMAALEMIKLLMDVVENHPEKSGRFFEIISKLPDRELQETITIPDVHFMRELINEAIFIIETEAEM